jgi:hypothetical protein
MNYLPRQSGKEATTDPPASLKRSLLLNHYHLRLDLLFQILLRQLVLHALFHVLRLNFQQSPSQGFKNSEQVVRKPLEHCKLLVDL